jgi:hypothetical protein
MGHTTILTTQRYIHPAYKSKVEAVAKLERFSKLARAFAERKPNYADRLSTAELNDERDEV